MRTFKDSLNREWNLTVDIATAKRLKTLLGLDILRPETNPLVQIVEDIEKLCNVLYVVIKPQADAKNITDEQFGEGLSADILLTAEKMLREELVDFFRKCGRPHLAAAITKQGEIIEQAMEQAEKTVNELDASKLIAGASSIKSPDVSELSPTV